MDNIAKGLIVIGSIILFAGMFLYAYNHVPFIGKLKGDITINFGGFNLYLPIMSTIILSLILTIIFNLF